MLRFMMEDKSINGQKHKIDVQCFHGLEARDTGLPDENYDGG